VDAFQAITRNAPVAVEDRVRQMTVLAAIEVAPEV